MSDCAPLASVELPSLSIAPGNHQLARLPPADLTMLAPHLERVVLKRGHVVNGAGALTTHVLLPELETLIGLFSPLVRGYAIKVACVDRTCALGMADAVENGLSVTRATVVLPGPALRIPAREFAAVATHSGPVRGMIRAASGMLMADMACNTACNAVHTAKQRVARWLLATHALIRDQAHSGAGVMLPLTQEQLADMFGLQRTTVTAIAQELRSAGAISWDNAKFRVRDRAALSSFACDCNEVVARAHRELAR